VSGVLYGEGIYGADPYGAHIPTSILAVTSITLDGVALDLDDVLADVTIRHGRAGYFDSASPSTCQIELLGVGRAFTRPFRLGSELIVNATDGSTVAPQFTGRLTDADLVGDELTAIAVGRLRTLSGYTVGAVAYPEEAWSARVARAFAEAGLGAVLELEVGAFDPVLVARPAEPVSLAAMLDELAETVESAVADRPDGRILVQALNARTGAGTVALDPAEVAYAPAWEMRLPAANVVTVDYGEPAASVSSRDASSVALYGPIAATITTDIKGAGDATTVVFNRLARSAYARWTIPAAGLLFGRRLPIGKPVGLSSLPPAAPFPSWAPVLEGWTDRIVSDGEKLVWTMELALSDPLLSGLTLAWQAIPADAAHRWNTINPAVAWLDALTLTDLDP
jgi:hypothetical protein